MPEIWTEVYRCADAAVSSDRCFMLTAVGIPTLMTQDEADYIVLVDSTFERRAALELARYAQESRPLPALPPPPPLKPGAVGASTLALCVLLAIAGAATRGWLGHDWYGAGVLDGVAVRDGAWWRTITALTLHADAAHLAANAGFGFLFGSACAALYGPGLGWLLVLACAVAANLAEASWMPPGMSSLGASTAVFAALGLVTARGRPAAQGRGLARGLYGALIAGSLLLTLLGTGDAHTDILGHGLGFLFGVGAGLPLRHARLDDRTIDRLGGLGALGLVVIGWVLALRTYP